MTNNGIKNIPTPELLKILVDAYDNCDQETINVYAYEIAFRLYSLKKVNDFGKYLDEFGYKNGNNIKKLTRE